MNDICVSNFIRSLFQSGKSIYHTVQIPQTYTQKFVRNVVNSMDLSRKNAVIEPLCLHFQEFGELCLLDLGI